jgi:hypothetical protein
MTSPVGELILDAEKRAQKKGTKVHTSEAPCGCQVTVSWFGEASRTTKTERCTEHALDPNRKRK